MMTNSVTATVNMQTADLEYVCLSMYVTITRLQISAAHPDGPTCMSAIMTLFSMHVSRTFFNASRSM